MVCGDEWGVPGSNNLRLEFTPHAELCAVQRAVRGRQAASGSVAIGCSALASAAWGFLMNALCSLRVPAFCRPSSLAGRDCTRNLNPRAGAGAHTCSTFAPRSGRAPSLAQRRADARSSICFLWRLWGSGGHEGTDAINRIYMCVNS
eukprot:scaffold1452_cov117-Isochrysis_galbana.AAC.4